MPQATGIEFYLSADSRMRLRDAMGQFIRLDYELALQTQKELERLGRELQFSIRREFQRHDRTPTSWDGAPAAGRIRTIDTLRVESGPMWVVISMAGGAPYVETGTPPHVISVRGAASPWTPTGTPGLGQPSLFQTGAKSLHWVSSGGEDLFAATVHHPGYEGDPFLERAIEDVDLEYRLSQIANNTISRLFPSEYIGITRSF